MCVDRIWGGGGGGGEGGERDIYIIDSYMPQTPPPKKKKKKTSSLPGQSHWAAAVLHRPYLQSKVCSSRQDNLPAWEEITHRHIADVANKVPFDPTLWIRSVKHLPLKHQYRDCVQYSTVQLFTSAQRRLLDADPCGNTDAGTCEHPLPTGGALAPPHQGPRVT